MRIEINRNVCSGHARCAAVAPELFTLDDVGFGEVLMKDGIVPPELEPSAERAALNCPEQAIIVLRTEA
jgi:ferredoxin